MCLHPELVRNKKYQPTKKNGGNVPAVFDERVLYTPRSCGKCMECMARKARDWRVRLHEELKTKGDRKFVTLTFSNEAIKKLVLDIEKYTNIAILRVTKDKKTRKDEKKKKIEKLYSKKAGYELDNEIATRAVRLFTERWRKEHKKSIRHWLVTELGHEGTENIHLHGIIWSKELEKVERIWQYGHVWKGYIKNGEYENYVNEKTVNYCVKYVNKTDKDHPNYRSKILTSKGIGSDYIKTETAKKHKYSKNTDETYRTRSGEKIALPMYYRNKMWTEEEKEKLWIEKLDKQKRYILGQEIDISKTEKYYYRALKTAQRLNKELGYGNNRKNWQQQEYEKQRREAMIDRRIMPSKVGIKNSENSEETPF